MKLRHQLVTLSLGLSLLLIVILGSLLALFIRHLLEVNLEEKGGIWRGYWRRTAEWYRRWSGAAIRVCATMCRGSAAAPTPPTWW